MIFRVPNSKKMCVDINPLWKIHMGIWIKKLTLTDKYIRLTSWTVIIYMPVIHIYVCEKTLKIFLRKGGGGKLSRMIEGWLNKSIDLTE